MGSYSILFGIVVYILCCILTFLCLAKFNTPQKSPPYPLTNGFAIPRVCHQAWKSRALPHEIKMLLARNAARNPSMKFELYDDPQVEHIIRTELPADVSSQNHRFNAAAGPLDRPSRNQQKKPGGTLPPGFSLLETPLPNLVIVFVEEDTE